MKVYQNLKSTIPDHHYREFIAETPKSLLFILQIFPVYIMKFLLTIAGIPIDTSVLLFFFLFEISSMERYVLWKPTIELSYSLHF